MGRYVTAGTVLDSRLERLVRQLAAELAGCRWCIERGRHEWRKAFLSLAELRALPHYAASPVFSERERAALAFAEAVSRYADQAGGIAEPVLAEVRRHYSEQEVAALTVAVAGEPFFNAATGALGADARLTVVGGAAVPGGRVRRTVGSAIRNLW
jgi:alkylhydroperoxidase family enzyme